MWDIVEIDNTYFGRIEEITVRYTTIRTFDMRQVVLPNTTLITVPIKTYSAEEVVKLKTKVNVHYDTDLNRAIAIIVEAINSMDQVINKKKTKAYISQFADSAIELTAMFFVNPNNGEYYEVTIGEANHRIKDYFTANGIVIPYPHVTITVDKADQHLLWTALFTAKNFIWPKTS